MNIKELLDKAKARLGTFRAVAAVLGMPSTRLSEYRSGKLKPKTRTIAKLAEIAELPMLETVAKVEADLRPDDAKLWRKALRTKTAKKPQA